jgi:hypothetical protein
VKELTLLAEIEHIKIIKTIPTAWQAGVWRYSFFTTGTVLPFMEDKFNREPIFVNNIIIDNEEYIEFETLDELWENLQYNRGGWVKDGEMIYVSCPNRRPPDFFKYLTYGVLEGYTNGKPLVMNNLMYRPGLLNAPKITLSADAYKYDRMKFNTATVTIDNTTSHFDDSEKYFGNEFNLKVGIVPEDYGQPKHLIRHIEKAGVGKSVATGGLTDEYITLTEDGEKEKPRFEMIAQYYIENISITLDKAEFNLSDKRERLSAKIPSRQYTNDPDLANDPEYGYYPDIDDKYIGKDIQEAYGHCYGVPGVCIEGKRVYVDPNVGRDELEFLDVYRFRFSSRIARIDRIQVKMTAGEIPNSTLPGTMKNTDGWTTVWDSADNWKTGVDRPFGSAGNITEFLKDGIITLRWDIAKRGGNRDNRVNEVRIDGIFNTFDTFPNGTPRATPLEIIKDIMYQYAGVPFDKDRYNTAEITRELKLLDDFEIGVMFDKSISVYEAIEKLQSASVLGFQFQIHKNLITARLDNPNRTECPAISHLEILNLHEVVVDWNASLYGTTINTEYAHNYSEQEESPVAINKEGRDDIMRLHRVEKEWKSETLFANKDDAELKNRILVEDFSKMRPIIKNIKLSGEKWLGLVKDYDELRIYDIMYIDFNIPGEEIGKFPQHLIRLISEVGEEKIVSMGGKTDEFVILGEDEKERQGEREFNGRMRCQIKRLDIDPDTGVTTIDVRVTERSAVWNG